jgi:hypothetical protein
MRSSENKELRNINNKLTEKIEHQSWLETELEKAKRRLEELALIVQNKMVSERELLELSEALQRDLVQSRAETLHYKQQIENRQYLQERNNEINLQLLHKVKHSQSDLFNNQVPIVPSHSNNTSSALPSTVYPTQHIINNDIRKESLFLRDKPSNLQKLTNWVNEEASEKANKNAENHWSRNNENHDDDSKMDHRNQHQKLW